MAPSALKIDLHTHILPRTWPDLRQRYGYGGFIQLEHHGPGCARMVMDGKLFREIEDKVEMYDLHATLLHLLGLDHKKVTFRFGGRDMRLTDVHGEVVQGVLA